jgi:multiple sugar transport system permease protein
MAQTATSSPLTSETRKVSTVASKKRQEAITGLAFITPALLILFVFLIVPMFAALYFSTTSWDGITPLNRGIASEDNPRGAYEFIGTQNYERLLFREGTRQETFYTALKNTIYYVIGVVPAQTILSLGLAVIVNQRFLKGRGFFRTAFYFPSITSSVVISLIFMWLFTSNGLVNLAIKSIFPGYQQVTWLNDPNGVFHNLLGVFGVTRQTVGAWASTEVASIRLWDWISGPSVTMLMIMILNVWTTTGTMMVIFLAALQNIPTQVYEAAIVDGANAWQIFRKITVPLLRPTTFFVITIGLIGSFQVFDQVFVITNGGPADTTLTIAYLVYASGFTDTRMGQAAATAIILFVIIFVFTLIQRRFVGERAEI